MRLREEGAPHVFGTAMVLLMLLSEGGACGEPHAGNVAN